MPELSIIVPVYKVEPYLSECIDSILAQTFTDFELILIDDGSPDRCGEICDEYAAKDRRIVVVHQENKGVSAARNAGLDVAKGNYIGFVDSDDWIEPEMYKILMNATDNSTASLAACCFCSDNEKPNESTMEMIKEFELTGGRELLYDLFAKPSKFQGVCWTKIISRSMIGECRFRETMVVWEDLVFLQSCYLQCISQPIKAIKLKNCLYHYRTNHQSATNDLVRIKYDKESFKKEIFDVLLPEDRECAKKALSYYLDSSIQLKQRYKQVSTERWARKAMLQIRSHILYWVIRSFFQRLLSKTERHRFLVEGVLMH